MDHASKNDFENNMYEMIHTVVASTLRIVLENVGWLRR
jgi:hypothetical protein